MKKIISLFLIVLGMTPAFSFAQNCFGLKSLESSETEENRSEKNGSSALSEKVCISSKNEKNLNDGYRTGEYTFTFLDKNGNVVDQILMRAYHSDFDMEFAGQPVTFLYGKDLKSVKSGHYSKLITQKLAGDESEIQNNEVGTLTLFAKTKLILTEIKE